MAGQWTNIDLSAKLFQNVDESVLRKSAAALENCFINEAGGYSRFPGLKPFVDLPGNAPTYIHAWSSPLGDLVAVSNSRVYKINRAGDFQDVTGAPVSGGQRVIFTETDTELCMSAGAEIIQLSGPTTQVLSENAPLAAFTGFLGGYLMAAIAHSNDFGFSGSEDYSSWDGLDTFSVNGASGEVTGLVITPYLEALLYGPNQVEQFELLPNGTSPFYRRWAVGEGILAPYTVVCVDAGTYGINTNYEFVRMTGQTSQPVGDDLHWTFEKVKNWDQAWAVEIQIKGQKFILVQIPKTMNAYGTLGLTCIFDYRQKKWYNLYGWDNGVPSAWPGTSYDEIWGRRFVGTSGGILELDTAVYDNLGQPQRILARTAHLDAWGPSFVHNVRMRVKRGTGTDYDAPTPQIAVRAIRDGGNSKTKWKYKSLGDVGDQYNTIQFGGMGHAESTWQFEIMLTDAVDVEIVKLEAEVERTVQ